MAFVAKNKKRADIDPASVNPLVIVVYGEDDYRAGRWVNERIGELLPGEDRSIGLSEYDLRDQSLGAALDDAEMVPWLGERKVIRVRSAMFLTGSTSRTDQSVSLAETERLIQYVQSPNPTTVLIFEVYADKLDERKKAVKALKENRCLLPFEPLEEEHVRMWLEDRARQRNINIELSGMRMLQARCGADLRRLNLELDKIELFADGRRSAITEEEIHRLVALPLEDDLFEFSGAVMRGDFAGAIRMLDELLRMKVEIIPMVAVTVQNLRTALLMLDLQAQGYSVQQMAPKAGNMVFRLQSVISKSRAGYYERALLAFLKADASLKTTGLDKKNVIEQLLLKLSIA